MSSPGKLMEQPKEGMGIAIILSPTDLIRDGRIALYPLSRILIGEKVQVNELFPPKVQESLFSSIHNRVNLPESGVLHQ